MEFAKGLQVVEPGEIGKVSLQVGVLVVPQPFPAFVFREVQQGGHPAPLKQVILRFAPTAFRVVQKDARFGAEDRVEGIFRKKPVDERGRNVLLVRAVRNLACHQRPQLEK